MAEEEVCEKTSSVKEKGTIFLQIYLKCRMENNECCLRTIEGMGDIRKFL